MKNLKTVVLMLLFAVMSTNVSGQEKEPVKAEKTVLAYKKGDKFESADFGTLTLVSEKKIQGILTWKTKAEKDGKSKTLFVPLTYLENCKRVEVKTN